MKILFVCTGNICRSPSAEAVLRHYLGDRSDIQIQSAGTQGYHVGEMPDSRAIQAAQRRQISMKGIKASKVSQKDFMSFDHIIALDRGHLGILENLQPDNSTAQLSLFSNYCSVYEGKDVPDPYYKDIQAFEDVLDILEDGARGIISTLLK